MLSIMDRKAAIYKPGRMVCWIHDVPSPSRNHCPDRRSSLLEHNLRHTGTITAVCFNRVGFRDQTVRGSDLGEWAMRFLIAALSVVGVLVRPSTRTAFE
jgi:hypothetical protein